MIFLCKLHYLVYNKKTEVKKMVSIDCKDIYSKTLLNDIKSRIIQNRMKLEGNKEKKTDAKMIEVIKD